MTQLDSVTKKDHEDRLDFLNNAFTEEQADLQQLTKPKSAKNNVIKIFIILILIFLVSGAMYLSEALFSTSDGTLTGINKFNPLKQLVYLIGSADKKIQGEKTDRINFLLLGIGGEGHEGPYLTDTIMVASLKPSTKEVALISLPRDMIVEMGGGRWQKINSVYALGRIRELNQGAEMITQAIETNLDLPIHYYLIVDFDGFKQFIDDIGDIEVNVEKGFVDNQYPTEDYLTTTVSFIAGPQLMDGDRALIFARSRHGTNWEGSDFARSRRQQLILQAVRDKILTPATLINPKRISSIFELLKNHLETNLDPWEALKLIKLAEGIDEQHIYRLVLDDSPGNLLESASTEEAGYILKPIDNNFTKLQHLVKNIFNTNSIKQEAANIEIQNGTLTTGLAFYTILYLEKLNYNIPSYGNALSQDYQKTVIYDFTDGEKPKTLEGLKDILQAYVTTEIPADIQEQYQTSATTNSNSNLNENNDSLFPDFLVILGFDHADSFKLPEPKPQETATSTASSTEETISEEEE
ncbi:LCP family protein [Patescibacteria group bacterium]|nr:LCP family protein [Patescibacteria group bacterium]